MCHLSPQVRLSINKRARQEDTGDVGKENNVPPTSRVDAARQQCEAMLRRTSGAGAAKVVGAAKTAAPAGAKSVGARAPAAAAHPRRLRNSR